MSRRVAIRLDTVRYPTCRIGKCFVVLSMRWRGSDARLVLIRPLSPALFQHSQVCVPPALTQPTDPIHHGSGVRAVLNDSNTVTQSSISPSRHVHMAVLCRATKRIAATRPGGSRDNCAHYLVPGQLRMSPVHHSPPRYIHSQSVAGCCMAASVRGSHCVLDNRR